MNRKLLITIATLVVIGLGAGVAVLLTKGYTFSPEEKRMVGTGIISVTSLPDGASVYLDGHLTTATNANLSQLQPKTYQVKILKEGFIPWEKQLEVKEGLVAEIKATLFPAIPTIYPLTFNGVKNPTLSPDGQKLAYQIPVSTQSAGIRQKGGVWIWTMSSAPISFSRSAEPHQIIASTPSLDFTKATLKFSPDAKQILITAQENNLPGEINQRNYLLPVDSFTSVADARDITPTITSLLKTWEDDQKTKDEARILSIKDLSLQKIASSSGNIQWSPDETRMMIGGNLDVRSGKIDNEVRNLKLDNPTSNIQSPNPASNLQHPISATTVYDLLTNKNYNLPEAKAYFWLPDSKHIVLVREGRISVIEFDGNNDSTVYAGKFEDSEVFAWPDSSRLVIVSSYDTPTGSQPNLFGVNLK